MKRQCNVRYVNRLLYLHCKCCCYLQFKYQVCNKGRSARNCNISAQLSTQQSSAQLCSAPVCVSAYRTLMGVIGLIGLTTVVSDTADGLVGCDGWEQGAAAVRRGINTTAGLLGPPHRGHITTYTRVLQSAATLALLPPLSVHCPPAIFTKTESELSHPTLMA